MIEFSLCSNFLLTQIPGYVGRLGKMCDTVLHMDSFAGSDKEKNPAFKEYHGKPETV